MGSMFNGAIVFNQDLSEWNDHLSNVTSMEGMFENATNFNQDLSWNFCKVTIIKIMFNAIFGIFTLIPANAATDIANIGPSIHANGILR